MPSSHDFSLFCKSHCFPCHPVIACFDIFVNARKTTSICELCLTCNCWKNHFSWLLLMKTLSITNHNPPVNYVDKTADIWSELSSGRPHCGARRYLDTNLVFIICPGLSELPEKHFVKYDLHWVLCLWYKYMYQHICF